MSRFQKNSSLVGVFVMVEKHLFRALQGSGEELGIKYLGGVNAGPPANASTIDEALYNEVKNEPDTLPEFSIDGAAPAAQPPWSATIHHQETDDVHLWIARDFRDTELGDEIENQAWLVFAPFDVATINSIGKLNDPDHIIRPTRIRLYAADNAPGLSGAAHNFGQAKNLDEL